MTIYLSIYLSFYRYIDTTQVDMDIICCHRNGLGMFVKRSKEESLEPRLELGQSGEISQTGRKRIPDRLSDETERELTRKFSYYFWNFSKASYKERSRKVGGDPTVISCSSKWMSFFGLVQFKMVSMR